MFVEWIVFGGIAFWSITLFALCAVVALAINSRNFTAFMVFALWLGIYTLLGDGEMFTWIKEHPYEILSVLGAYFTGGLIWSLYKWNRYLSKLSKKISDLRKEFFKSKDEAPEIVRQLNDTKNHNEVMNIIDNKDYCIHYFIEKCNKFNKTEFRLKEIKDEDLESYLYIKLCVKMPIKASEHKSMILEWMIFWPFLFIYSIVKDPIYNTFIFIYNNFIGVFQKMANNAYNKAMKD